MDRLLYIAMNGAKHSMLQQAVTANNLANASTNGYKAQNGAFRALPVYGPGMPTRTFVVDSTPNADLSGGTLTTTGRPLDMAVHGRGWFAVQDAKGGEAYTRNGAFEVTDTGLLVTNNGLPVIGDGGTITVPPDSEVNIAKDGTVTLVANGLVQNAVSIGRLKLVNPADSDMVRGDDGLFRTKTNTPAQADASVNLAAGALETSNVSAVNSLIDMIDHSRLFDMQIKLMQTADDNSKDAVSVMSINA
ncbi:MAG TPA: flagellar basal-body rod protein FlgF [Methylophilaceae bacterium]|jgi:flagellar basal-body rod protein FlgF